MSSTTDNEQRFAYLLSPEFQIVNTAGKPLTGGWIEVYIHGTRVKYYCFSDFDGTLHPFQIPLDSLGSNIVLASPTHAYDIYIYNKFGSLVMSRYNVVPACNAADIVEDVVVIDSPDETINVTCDGGSNWHLEVNTDLIATASGLAEVSGALTEVSGALLNKKDKQEPIDVSGSVTKTVTNIKQNENGEIEITYEDIDLPQQVPNVDIISPSGTLDITSTTDPATNTKTFKIDVHKSNMDYFEGYYGKSHYEDRSNDSNTPLSCYVDQWQEYKYQGDFIANSWQDENNINFILNSGLYLIHAEIAYDMHNTWSDPEHPDPSKSNDDEYMRIYTGAFNGLENGTRYKDWSREYQLSNNTIQMTFIRNVEDDDDYQYLNDNHYLYFAPELPFGANYVGIRHLQIVKLDSIVTYHGGPGPSYKPGYGIEILDDVISVATGTVVTNNYFNTVVSSINNEINEINTTIQNVTGDITELSEIVTNIVGVTGDFVNRDEFNVVTGDITNINEAITNIIGATGDYATKDYVDEAVSGLENYSAGQYISIEDHVINVTGVQPEGDYATNADLQTVSAAIPESEDVEFEELDLAQFAQASAVTVIQNQVNSVTGDITNINEAITNIIGATGDYATEEYVDEAIAAVTGQPFEQVNSDWLATSGVAEILNKPDVFQLIAGDNIDITPSGNDLVISASSDVTKAYVDEQIDAVTGMIPTLPEEEEVEFEEINLSDYALASAIPDVSDFATEQYVDEAVASVTGSFEQVQSDWDQDDDTQVDYIKNKPVEKQLIAGQNITIDVVANGIEISATSDVTKAYVDAQIDAATGMIPEDTVSHTELSDAIDSATALIPDVSNFVTQQDIDNSIAPVQSQIDELAAATGDYLTEQVNADWNATSGVSEILNKPESEAVEFEEINLSDYALASAIPSLDGYATETYVDEQIAAVTGIIPSDVVTEQELADAIDAATGLIPDVSNLATNADLQTVSGAVDAVSGAIPESEAVEFEELDLSIYALASAVPDTTQLETDVANLAAVTGDYLQSSDLEGYATEAYVDAAITGVSFEQVNADWDATSGVAEILNKPEIVEYDLSEISAGEGISIVSGVNGITISATGQGGAEYIAGQYITINDNTISVTGISAGDGTLSVVQNVTGAPLEITYPTDVAPDTVFYQINSVSGYAYATGTGQSVVNYYYGETPADFNGSDDSILFTINDDISNIGAIFFYYTTAETGMGGPNLTTTSINGGSTGIVQSGTYKLKAQYNQAGTSSPYGKYLQIMFNWRNYASDAAQSIQWAQEALSKITFFGVVRPDPTLGVTVNLDRYYLGGNVVTNKPINSGLPAQIWLNPETKKQEVYLPNVVPSSWNINSNTFYNYTSTPTNIAAGSVANSIAYKYDSTTDKYIYARMTSSIKDTSNSIKKAEFVTLEPVNGKFEKWTYDYSDYSNRHWTTETIEIASPVSGSDGIAVTDNVVSLDNPVAICAGNGIDITITGASAVLSVTGALTEQELASVSGTLQTEIQIVSAAIPDTSSFATETDLQTVSGAVDTVSGLIPASEDVQFEELDLSNYALASAIPDVSNFVTEAELATVSGTLDAAVSGKQNVLTDITDVIVTSALPLDPVATVLYLIPEA